ncbi:hypothetical protein LOZ58_002524 [Ophidiomyces ophidiicola]|nr:hypothetical protein LOZ65_003004 [Ophidiomyces ophidiicola]KAI1962900.1 hypothetical protein LOZ58_002524 [Ophidiomyces ophidiicola]
MKKLSNTRVYCELLPNICQVTIYVTLPHCSLTLDWGDESPELCTLEVTQERDQILISSEGQKQLLRLPARLSLASLRMSPVILGRAYEQSHGTSKQEDLLFRFPVNEIDRDMQPPDIRIPWSAKEMSPGTRIKCRFCGNMLLAAEGANEIEWKDLPSANWAELMDMWHCHKPDPLATEENSIESPNRVDILAHSISADAKGYGMSNQTVCQLNTVFVDVMNFYLSNANSIGVENAFLSADIPIPTYGSQVGQSEARVQLRCTSCRRIVGEKQPSIQGIALSKSDSSIAMLDGSDDKKLMPGEVCSVDEIISAQLLEQTERTGARRYIIHPDDGKTTNSGLLIWVFNPNLRYSYLGKKVTAHDRNGADGLIIVEAQQAIKVFYRSISDISTLLNPEIGVASLTSLEELPLPPHIYEEIKQVLIARNGLLPDCAKIFKEWEVSLLHISGNCSLPK